MCTILLCRADVLKLTTGMAILRLPCCTAKSDLIAASSIQMQCTDKA